MQTQPPPLIFIKKGSLVFRSCSAPESINYFLSQTPDLSAAIMAQVKKLVNMKLYVWRVRFKRKIPPYSCKLQIWTVSKTWKNLNKKLGIPEFFPY